MAKWTVSYKADGNERTQTTTTKLKAVALYLKLMETMCIKISELKILRNGKDYTTNLNEFLKG